MSITVTEIRYGLEGIDVAIDAGIFGTFTFRGAYVEVQEDGEVLSYGECSPVYRNGQYFLPWHVAAALTHNGTEMTTLSEAQLVLELLKMRCLYTGSRWFDAVRYANQLTGSCVY